MNNDTKVKIAMSDMVLQVDNETFWTGGLVNFKAEKTQGIIYLKFKNNKIVGKCGFKLEKVFNDTRLLNELEHNIPQYTYELFEYELEDYGALHGVETILPPEQLGDKMEKYFEDAMEFEFIGGTNFKMLINSTILNQANHSQTVTTKQNRIPNSGIVIDNYDYLISLYDDLFKDKEQLRLDLYD